MPPDGVTSKLLYVIGRRLTKKGEGGGGGVLLSCGEVGVCCAAKRGEDTKGNNFCNIVVSPCEMLFAALGLCCLQYDGNAVEYKTRLQVVPCQGRYVRSVRAREVQAVCHCAASAASAVHPPKRTSTRFCVTATT